MGLQFERRVKLAGAKAARTFLRQQVTGHVRLDLGFSGENLLTLDALIAPRCWLGYRRKEGRLLLVMDHHLVVGVKTILANVSLVAVRSHPIGDQIGRLEMALAERARVEGRFR